MAWADFQWIDWGGTPHLEDLDAAHLEWQERLARFSSSSAFRPWDPRALQFALEAASEARATSTTALEYWDAVGSSWSSNSSQLAQWMDPDQLNRVLALLGQSSIASEGLATAREMGQLGPLVDATIDATKKDLKKATPWYVWGLLAIGTIGLLRGK